MMIWIKLIASTILGIGLFLGLSLLALMHGDLGRTIDDFFANYAAPTVASVFGLLLIWVILRSSA